MTTLDLHGGINKYAVYNGVSDAPLTDPLNNLTNLLWHSDLKFVGRVTSLTGSVDLSPNSSGWTISGDTRIKTIAAHGRSYTPFLVGYIQVGANKLPINGTFYSRISTNYVSEYSFYADATNVYVTHRGINTLGPSGSASVVSAVCSYRIDVLNAGTDASGNLVMPTFFNGFEATATRLRCGYFDTDVQYMIESAGGDILFTGTTLSQTLARPNYISATCMTICFVHKIGSYTELGMAAAGDTGSGFTPPTPKVVAFK